MSKKYELDKPVNVLSLGAGVQSSALLLLCYDGKLDMNIDFAVFADTQSEPQEVYDWLEKLTDHVKDKIKVIIDTKGNLAETFLDLKQHSRSIPVYLKNPDGSQGAAWRQCTYNYKIAVVQKAVRKELGYLPRKKMRHKVNMIMGISTDEIVRMKTSQIKWITNIYPLINTLDMNRQDCIDYVESTGLGTPPRSACYMCPYRSDAEWFDIKTEQPELFAMAVDFDKKIRENNRFNSIPYIHRSMVPLDEIVFTKNQDIFDGFINECEGMCGI